MQQFALWEYDRASDKAWLEGQGPPAEAPQSDKWCSHVWVGRATKGDIYVIRIVSKHDCKIPSTPIAELLQY